MSRKLWQPRACAFLLALYGTVAFAATDAELDEIRAQLATMRDDYEARISALEARLAEAEARPGTGIVEQPIAAVRSRPASSASVTAENAFNPRISLILDGNYHHDGADGRGPDLSGEAFQPSRPPEHDHEHHGGGNANGFNLRESELVFSATVDPYFDASAYLAVDKDGDVELEEAWFLTRGLPRGLKLKGGKFLSDFGYQNQRHPHQWDFVDQNLPYLNLLGDHGLRDVGVQLSWLPELPWYTKLGVELLEGGDQERLGALADEEVQETVDLDDEDDGPRLFTAYAKLAPELGYDHALQLGLSYAFASQHQEVLGEDDPLSGLEGDADLWGLEAVYRYDHPARFGHRDLKLQAEYLLARKDLDVESGPAEQLGTSLELVTDGAYLQGVYGVAPRWDAGLRYDLLGARNEIRGAETGNERFGDSDRWSAMLTWRPSEFSSLRMQWSYSDLLTEEQERESFHTVWLQYLFSLGTHGAHNF